MSKMYLTADEAKAKGLHSNSEQITRWNEAQRAIRNEKARERMAHKAWMDEVFGDSDAPAPERSNPADDDETEDK